jgi:hypothetical protein
MRMRRLKLILLLRSVPNDDIKLRELLEGPSGGAVFTLEFPFCSRL